MQNFASTTVALVFMSLAMIGIFVYIMWPVIGFSKQFGEAKPSARVVYLMSIFTTCLMVSFLLSGDPKREWLNMGVVLAVFIVNLVTAWRICRFALSEWVRLQVEEGLVSGRFHIDHFGFNASVWGPDSIGKSACVALMRTDRRTFRLVTGLLRHDFGAIPATLSDRAACAKIRVLVSRVHLGYCSEEYRTLPDDQKDPEPFVAPMAGVVYWEAFYDGLMSRVTAPREAFEKDLAECSATLDEQSKDPEAIPMLLTLRQGFLDGANCAKEALGA